jgi:hypothetical protein
MATYKHLRSSTANKRPTTSIADGQLAINTNTASPGLFFKDSAGTGIVKVGPVHVGTTAPNATPAAGGSSGNYLGEQWLDTSVSPSQMKVWNGSAWIGIVADELPVSKLQDGDARQLLQTDAAGTGVEWTSNVDVPGTLDVTSTATFDSIARHPLGSAAAPTLTFTGDLNTGIYSPGADQVAVSTGGALRITVDASGRLLVGTSSARSNFFNTASSAPQQLQVEGTTGNTCSLSSICSVADTSGGRLLLAHQRSGAVGGNTILNSGDQAGYITFQGNDGGEFVECASIEAQVDGTPGANDMPGRLVFSTTSDGASSPTERLRITSAGLVGIGTSSPQVNLQVNAASDATIALSNSSSVTSGNRGNISCFNSDVSSVGVIRFAAVTDNVGTEIQFHTRPAAGSLTQSMTLDSAGRLGIGTTSADQLLVVSQNAASYNPAIKISNPNTGRWGGKLIFESATGAGVYDAAVIKADGGGGFGGGNLIVETAGSERCRVDGSGRLLIGTSSARSNVYIGGSSATPLIQSETSGSTYNNGASLLTYSSVNYAPILTLGTSNSDTAGTNAALGLNYALGFINFVGNDGTNFRSGAWISAAVDGSVSTGDLPTRLTFSTTADGASSPTERMRIDSAGNVGIGTTSPQSKFAVSNGGADGLEFTTNSDQAIVSYNRSTSAYAPIGLQGSQIVFSAPTERARIDSSGRLLIGTSSSPSLTDGQYSKLHVIANSNTASGEGIINIGRGQAASSAFAPGTGLGNLFFTDSAGAVHAAVAAATDGTTGAGDYPGRLVFSTTADGASAPTERMRIDQNGLIKTYSTGNGHTVNVSDGAGTSTFLYAGNRSSTDVQGSGATTVYYVYSNGTVQNATGTYTTISDAKLKENIVDASSQWNDLKAIQIRNWNFKAETGHETHRQIGPIAQELEEVCPGLVFETPDRDADGNETGEVTKGVSQSVLYMKAVKALQEAMERIETLEGMVAVNNITIDEQQHQLSTLAARLTALETP